MSCGYSVLGFKKCYFHSHIGLKNMASAHNQKPNNLLYPAIMWFWVLIKGSNKVHSNKM
jgi:hypothetical protein